MNHLQRYTPVRDIVYNSRSVTGMVPLLGEYESTLERDLMEILRFDPNVEYFTAQPVTIGYCDQFGKMRTYTPDGLIPFKPTASLTPQPVLYEVKYRADFRQESDR
ncbi:TnsA endonuclease N-terminal domain-containing protein [Chromobacterium sphagni]|uniref:TnsA endonuclease N-terminal domain-containing protein n=1 Tax=Chromobacterium sphagni TaxID=1903179 RepID=UPI000B1F894C|nr:TnsA endonuclease N-terminal domain-containing protein [Chromobacterium sphagni]